MEQPLQQRQRLVSATNTARISRSIIGSEAYTIVTTTPTATMSVTAAAAVLTAPTVAGATRTETGPLMYLAIVCAMTLVSVMILRDAASTRDSVTRTVTPSVEGHAAAAAAILGKNIGLRKKMVLEKVAVSGMSAVVIGLAGIETIIAVVITAILMNRAIVG